MKCPNNFLLLRRGRCPRLLQIIRDNSVSTGGVKPRKKNIDDALTARAKSPPFARKENQFISSLVHSIHFQHVFLLIPFFLFYFHFIFPTGETLICESRNPRVNRGCWMLFLQAMVAPSPDRSVPFSLLFSHECENKRALWDSLALEIFGRIFRTFKGSRTFPPSSRRHNVIGVIYKK